VEIRYVAYDLMMIRGQAGTTLILPVNNYALGTTRGREVAADVNPCFRPFRLRAFTFQSYFKVIIAGTD
jgi:hypothetical protein